MQDKPSKTTEPGDSLDRPRSEFVRVAAIAPFWRYAVGPTAAHSPAVPYYRIAAAEAFFEEAKRELPWAGVVLYKRRGLRGIEVLREYTPNAEVSASAREKSKP